MAVKNSIFLLVLLSYLTTYSKDNNKLDYKEDKASLSIEYVSAADITIPSNFDFTNIPSSYANNTWIITETHDLGGASITIPSNVRFDFRGGSIQNGTITFNNSYLPSNSNFKTSTFKGTIIYDEINLENLGATSQQADDTRNYSILYTALNTSHVGTVIIPEYNIYIDPLTIRRRAESKNKTLRGISKASRLIMTSKGTIMTAENVLLENFTFDNSLAPLNGAYRLVNLCSDLIMRNIDFYCKVRPMRLSALESTGRIENVTIEDSHFISAVGVGGTEPTLTINEDETSYDMNILIQNNIMEGGTLYWGEGGDIPDFATIDVSGTGITIINNIVEASQYAGAINLEASEGDTQSLIAYNTINLNNVTNGGGNGASFTGILLGKSNNVWVHHNNITGSEELRGLLSFGISCSATSDNVGDIIIEDNNIDGVNEGLSVNEAGSAVFGGYSIYFRRNNIRNFRYGADVRLRGTSSGSEVHFEDNTFYADNGSVLTVRSFGENGYSNNTDVFARGNTLDLIDRSSNFDRGFFGIVELDTSLKSFTIQDGNGLKNNNVGAYIYGESYYKYAPTANADKLLFQSLNTYVSPEIDLSDPSSLQTSLATLTKAEAIYDISFEYVEASSSNSGVDIDIYFATSNSGGTNGTRARYRTESNISPSTIKKNWVELAVDGYPSASQNYLNLYSRRNKTGSGKIIVTVRTFDLSIDQVNGGSINAYAGQDVSICSGDNTTLTASGGSTYLWNTGATTNSITVSPNSTQTYTVTASDSNGNSDTDDVIVTVNSTTANAGADVTIDEGQNTTLSASGGGSYLWNTGATSQSITVSPSSTQTYSVTVTLNGCDDSDDVIVTVNPSTSVTANAGQDVSICSGESTTLTASGGSTYLWNTGATTNSITVSPSSTQTYTVTASDSNGNSDSDDVIVTVNSVTANAGTDVTIDEGQSTTLNASGGGTYLWNTGATTQSITVSPLSNQTYSVIVTLNGCEDTDAVNVTVNPSTGSVTANAGQDVSICSGESTTLTASGGSTYLWNTGATTNSITVSPNSTQTYIVTASDSNGNSDSDDVLVTVNSVTANAGVDVTIDEGQSTTLSASGGGTYLWNTGATTQSITVSPLSTQTYSVIVSLNGCDDTDEVNVRVNPSSGSVTANAGQDVSICSGESTTLTASGGSTYLWNTGATTTSITVSPNSTQTYTVTASDSNGNSDSDDVIVTVNSVTANAGADVTIDEGQSTTLNASGGGTYLWNTGATTQSITVSPNSTQTYSVTVTLNGCEDTDEVNVTVNSSTGGSVTANAGEDVTICLEEIVELTATGGTSYLWNTGETTQSITVSPTTTTIYSVTVSDGNSIDVDDLTVTVDETCSGISYRLIERQSKLYPNPTDGILNIELANFSNKSIIRIFDLKGKLVYSDSVDNFSPVKILKHQINLSHFSKGIYFVKLSNSNYKEVKKVLVY